MSTNRLCAYVAHAGICSRRKAVDIIKEGLVTVNNKVVNEPWYVVQESDTVAVGKHKVRKEKSTYIILNKPSNCITSVADEKGRRTVLDYVSGACKERVYPVGRLDKDTTGLLLLTNDGSLAQKLSHPRNEVTKVYQVVLDKPLQTEHFLAIKKGIRLRDGVVRPDKLYFVSGKPKYLVTIALHSGKNRIVRRIFEAVGYTVRKLDRYKYAGLTKKGLSVGRWRYLQEGEIKLLQGLKKTME